MVPADESTAEVQNSTEGNGGAKSTKCDSATSAAREARLSDFLEKKAKTLSAFVPVEGSDSFTNEIKALRKLREAAAKNKKVMTRNLRNRERQKGRLTKKASGFTDDELLQVLSNRALRVAKRQCESQKNSERRRAEYSKSWASEQSS